MADLIILCDRGQQATVTALLPSFPPSLDYTAQTPDYKMKGLEEAASIIEVSAKVASLCSQYSVGVEDAKAYERIQREVTQIKDILKVVQQLLSRPSKHGPNTSRKLHHSLNSYFLYLNKLNMELGPGSTRKALSIVGSRALRWPFKSKKVEKIISHLEGYKQTFYLALQVDRVGLMIDLDQKIGVSNTKVNAIHRSAPIDHSRECCYCVNGRSINIIQISDLRVGIETGCTICWALSQGIVQLRASLLDKDLQLFNNLAGIVLNGELKPSKSWTEPTVNDTVLPLDIYIDAKATLPPDLRDVKVSNNVPTQLRLSNAVSITKKWIASCNKYHPLCALQPSPRLPSRVLDIGMPGDENGLKLAVKNGECAMYVALSYCWGTSQNTLTTTTDSLPIHLDRIAWQKLPKTFQDTIALCCALDIQYLWIDALCILQDDLADWERESAKMASVYSNSYITIAATSCPNSNTSLFSDRWSTFPMPGGSKLRIQTDAVQINRGNQTLFIRPSLHLAHDRFIETENAKDHLADAPLLSRAWAFQERLLPSPTLHFHAEELVWECNTSMRCECSSMDHPSLRVLEDGLQTGERIQAVAKPQGWLKPLLTRIEDPKASLRELSFAWLDFVSEFSRLDLTSETDRLPALSGLAKRLSRPVLGRYFAGIWEEDLAAGLLYESKCEESYAVLPTHRPNAPSWSWASIPLQDSNFITYSHMLGTGFLASTDFALVAVKNEVIGENPFGWVSGSTLTVRGKFCDCNISKNSSGLWALGVEHSNANIDKETAIFLNDGRVYIEGGIRLSCLYMGTCEQNRANSCNAKGYGLVLQKISVEGHVYRRVGLMVLARTATWIPNMSVTQINII